MSGIQRPGTVMMMNPLEVAAYQRGLMAGDLMFSEAKLRRALKAKDRQQALSRFKWNLDVGESGLKVGFTEMMLEGMLYDRYVIGSGVVEDGVLDIFIPAWSLGIDRYGRMRGLKPMFPTAKTDKGEFDYNEFDKEFKVVYTDHVELDNDASTYCAVCYDYTAGAMSTGGEARLALQARVIEEMSDLYNYSTINLVNSLGIAKYHLLDEAQKDAVEQEVRAMYSDLKRGKFYQLTSSMQNIQDLTKPIAYNGQAYWQSYNSLNNERLGFLGLVNSGTFNKKERKLVDETNVESANSELVIENSLRERKHFCEMLNFIYGTNFSVEIVEQEVQDDFSEFESSVPESEDI